MIKKGIYVVGILSLFLILVLSLSFSIAADAPLLTIPADSESGSLGDFQNSAENTLSQQVIIPAELEAFTKTLFNLDQNRTVDLQTFIIYLVIWIMILLLIKSVLGFMPLFNEEWKAWIGAVIITLLMSTTGSIKASAVWFMSFGKLFSQTNFLWFLFDLVILIIISAVFFSFLKLMKSKIREEKARTIGMKTGMP